MIGKQFNKDAITLAYITILTAIALVYGFTIIPSPALQQMFAIDHKRVVNLGYIQSSIDTYYQTNSQLPKSLNELTTNSYNSQEPLSKIDPQTKQPNGYIITSSSTYKLCATFATNSSKEDVNSYDITNNYDYPTFKDKFKHPVGYYCFNEKEYQNTYNSSNSPTPSFEPNTSPIYNQLSPIPTVYEPKNKSIPYSGGSAM
ncbi:MAG TPA: hypothetical protein VNW29_06075 [Candidatus Sulfotelmatobacter sp.]|jgi:hypothetical protein|nr:hypothetical protein [Candidatus Sulfotelmatobacter sp.]